MSVDYDDPRAKPCPFCGRPPAVHRTGSYTGIGCEDQGCALQPYVDHESEDRAFELWNHRAGITGEDE